jgi:hypothetical protein
MYFNKYIYIPHDQLIIRNKNLFNTKESIFHPVYIEISKQLYIRVFPALLDLRGRPYLVQILGQLVTNVLNVAGHLSGRNVDRHGRECHLLQWLLRAIEHILGAVAEREALVEAYALLGQDCLVDGRAALGRPVLEAAMLVAEQEATADLGRDTDDRVEHGVEVELAEEALHRHAVQREPDLGYAQVEETADDVVLAKATASITGGRHFHVQALVDLFAAAGEPQVHAVEAVRVDVVAHAHTGEAVRAGWRGQKVRVCPADAAMRWTVRGGTRLYKVDFYFKVPLLVH